MNKSLYFIECICIRDCKFPNVEYHKGEVVYFNPKAASNETYIYCGEMKIRMNYQKRLKIIMEH